MKNTHMLKKSGFKKIYNHAPSYAGRSVVMLCMKNDLAVKRLGIVASKKVGNSVMRNKARRRIKNGYDIVIIARAAIHQVTFADLEKSVLKLLRKFELYEKNDRL